ncbi:alpha-L-rhamnosidase C-terminal domain-containing protein, partial [Lachnoclostridium sp.]|uniref:alpha-L-rhamnosidase C-terminal domain-containing protein n=1 Tax=Lachnoclostridium sp. TaxID=2028282 RepID=UPI00289E6043
TARAMAGDINGCLKCIKEYWGGMLQLGATTFWEDFDIDWMENAAKIDELVWEKSDKIDVHGTYGKHCYKGYRHSLCHGWAAGVTPWLTENILGVKVIDAGCKTIKITPQLGDLEWAEGTFPTPYGIIRVKHQKMKDGTIQSQIDAPKEIIIRK